jgi:hypothetical protein
MWQQRGRFKATDNITYDAESWSTRNSGRPKNTISTINALIYNQDGRCFACGCGLKQYKEKFVENIIPKDMGFLMRVRIQDARKQVAVCHKCVGKIQVQRKEGNKNYADKIHRCKEHILELQEVLDSIYHQRGLTAEEINITHKYHKIIYEIHTQIKQMKTQ